LFDINNLKEGWVALLKKREFNKRTFIILLIVAFELEVFMDNGKRASLYLFFRNLCYKKTFLTGSTSFGRKVFDRKTFGRQTHGYQTFGRQTFGRQTHCCKTFGR
jgi:hypothetical protein